MVSNEQIIAALLKSGSATQAAHELGIAPQTIYRRMNGDAEFKALYKFINTDLLRDTVSAIRKVRIDAVLVIVEIMKDETVNPAIRLQAAQGILSNDLKYSGQLNGAEHDIDDFITKQEMIAFCAKKLKEQKDFEDKKLKEIKKRGVTHGISRD